MTRNGLYKGISSFEFQRNKNFSVTDIELVKIDLLNHIFTKKGSRVMMPEFGTVIPELIFEPLDDETLEILEDELRFVFDYDPRVSILSLDIIPQYNQNMVAAVANLYYIELDLVADMELNIQFEN